MLAEREAALAEHESAYTRFVATTGQRLAVLLAERAELDAEIARLLLARTPDDPDLAAWSDLSSARAEELRTSRESFPPADDDRDVGPREPDPELRSLFRTAAKRFHPDLAATDTDRERRMRLMAELNRCYADRDAEGLREVLERNAASPAAIEGDDVASRLVRTLRQIAQVEARLRAIDGEEDGLRGRPLWDLFERWRADAGVVEHLEERLRGEIHERRAQRDALAGA